MPKRKRKDQAGGGVNVSYAGPVSFGGDQNNINGTVEGDVVFHDYLKATYEETFTKSVTVKLSETQVKMVDQIAHARFQDRSEYLRSLVDENIRRWLGR